MVNEMAFLGWPELILILVIIVVIFGAGRITGLGKAVGNAVREFRKAQSGAEEKEKKEDKKESGGQ